MSRLGAAMAFPLALSCAVAAHAEGLVLAADGRSAYRIVIPQSAAAPTRHAAEELQSFLRQTTGATLALVTDAEPAQEAEVLVGFGNRTEGMALAAAQDSLGEEGFIVQTEGTHLVIAGGQPRGDLYGVYTFLEEHVGCRWYTAKLSRIPLLARLTVGPLREVQRPLLNFREVYYAGAMDPDFAARQKLNGNCSVIGEGRIAREIHGRWGTWCHSSFEFVHPQRYFAAHPEYFALVNGKRIPDGQLCFSNPEVLRLTVEALREWMARDPEASIWDVSQMDCVAYCQCPDCAAIDEREGTHMGSLLTFINKVAEAFPDKTISTLAYQYTRKPPKALRPEANVSIKLCDIECNHSLPIALDPSSASFRADLEAWSAICANVVGYDYVVQFSNLVSPFPNLRVMQPDLQYFVRNHARGMFVQGNREARGEWCDLRAYLVAKLLWNPDCDLEAHQRDVIEGLYGVAAPEVTEYLRLLQEELVASGKALSIFGSPRDHRQGYLSPANLARYGALFDRAEQAAAADPELLLRVREARLPLLYAELETQYGDRDHRRQVAARLFETATAVGLRMFNEWNLPIEAYREKVDRDLKREADLQDPPLVTLVGQAVRVQVAPILGGRIVGLQVLPEVTNLCAPGAPGDRGWPFVGGYDELWSTGAWGRGPTEEFTAEAAESAEGPCVILRAGVGDEVRIERRITAWRAAAGFDIASTANNPAKEKLGRGLWCRLRLTAGPTDGLTLHVPGRAAGTVIPLALPAAEATGDWWFAPAELAAGLVLADHARGVGLRLRLSLETTALAWVHVDARRNVVTLGVKGVGCDAETGPLTLRQRYEFLDTLEGFPRPAAAALADHAQGRILCQANRMFLENYGNEVTVAADPTATGGYAARLTTHHPMWTCGWFYDPAEMDPDTTYDLYARVRVEKLGADGGAFTAGAWDDGAGRCLGSVGPTLAQVADSQWQVYKLATIKPGANHYLWCGPVNNPAGAAALWLDYFAFRPAPPGP